MAKIKSIKVINNELIEVGKNGIVKIENKSMEFDNSMYSMHLCYDKDDDLIKSIEQCPIIITYFKE